MLFYVKGNIKLASVVKGGSCSMQSLLTIWIVHMSNSVILQAIVWYFGQRRIRPQLCHRADCWKALL